MNGGDPGLQPERTELAWRRTHLSLVVAALVVARHPLAGGQLWWGLGTATVIAAVSAFLLLGRRRVGMTAAAAAVIALVEVAGIIGMGLGADG
ncbi:DUF202 domain-containing protein [Nocardioides sp. NPDC006273]|uniref:DUF202 domain-containing protein n=1 Tax=Nocardioides sp. NPDC006273 TaxID=3155598 RepID=UPI0033BDFDC8